MRVRVLLNSMAFGLFLSILGVTHRVNGASLRAFIGLVRPIHRIDLQLVPVVLHSVSFLLGKLLRSSFVFTRVVVVAVLGATVN